jgi:hypothetical protein
MARASGARSSDRVVFHARFAMAVGFGGLLAIMALAGVDALNVLRQFRRSDDQIRRRYLSQNHVLNDIRSDVYVSGTYVRDYLLEPDAVRGYLSNQSGRGAAAHGNLSGVLPSRGCAKQKANTIRLCGQNSWTIGGYWRRSSSGTQRKGSAPGTLFFATRFFTSTH